MVRIQYSDDFSQAQTWWWKNVSGPVSPTSLASLDFHLPQVGRIFHINLHIHFLFVTDDIVVSFMCLIQLPRLIRPQSRPRPPRPLPFSRRSRPSQQGHGHEYDTFHDSHAPSHFHNVTIGTLVRPEFTGHLLFHPYPIVETLTCNSFEMSHF